MSSFWQRMPIQLRIDLMRALRVAHWAVPVVMASIGIGYMLLERQRHAGDSGWPWTVVLGLFVFGVVGPALLWFYMHWAVKAADAYRASQEQLQQRADELGALNALSVAAGRSLDLDATMAAILEQTMAVLGAQAGIVFVQESGRPGLRLKAQRGLEMTSNGARLSPGPGLCGQVMSSRQVLFATDVEADPRCSFDHCICSQFRSAAYVPLEAKGELLGLMQLGSPHAGHFTEAQRDFLTAVAGQVGAFVENARLYDAVQTFNVALEEQVNQRTRELEAAQKELAEKARQLQRLLSESYRIQEETRARIAHDMHDGVTQIIIGALYETQAAREAMGGDCDRAVENLSRAQRLLSQAETEIRRVIYDLHPPVLDTLGLVVALRRFAATFTVTFGIDCRLKVDGRSRRLSKDEEIAVYRIVQAALHNVATHAEASQVKLAFRFDVRRLQVIIEDDGIGFDAIGTMARPGKHLGLIGMKERAESLGASIAVDSRPGEGTRVCLELVSPHYVELLQHEKVGD